MLVCITIVTIGLFPTDCISREVVAQGRFTPGNSSTTCQSGVGLEWQGDLGYWTGIVPVASADVLLILIFLIWFWAKNRARESRLDGH